MASPTSDFPKKSYRVELAYRFKSKRPGVLLGMTIKAFSDEDAIERAIANHIKPYPARIYIQCTATES